MSMSIEKMCRTCLVSETAMLSLFDSRGKASLKSASIVSMLKSFTAVVIAENDGLPGQVCLSCISEINRAHSFKMKCETSETTLKEYLQQSMTTKEQIFELKEESKVFEETVAIEKRMEEPIELAPEPEEPMETEIQEVLTEDEEIDEGTLIEFHTDPDGKSQIYVINEENLDSNEILIYSCSICCKTFQTKDEFDDHTKDCKEVEKEETASKANHSKSRRKQPVKCPHCPIDFVHQKNLEKHISKYHNPANFDKKDEISTNPDGDIEDQEVQELSDTEDVENLEEAAVVKCELKELPQCKYRCENCAAGFATSKSLACHIKQNKCTQKQFECSTCKRVFINRRSLLHHLKTHRNKKIQCAKCSKIFSRQDKLKAHMDIDHNGIVKNQCRFCGKAFAMLSTLKDHLRTHSGEKPFLCSICGKGFSQNTNLKQHMMRHTKTKPFKCNQCEYSFVSKGELNAHIRKHTGDHPFVCDTCGSGFTTSSSLVKHKRIHTGERPYPCEFCPMRFTALGTLKNHRRTHTGEKPFICQYCDRAFTQRSDCVSHMRTHTGERPYVCSICGYSFQQSGTMRTHLRTHMKYSEQNKSSADEGESNTNEILAADETDLEENNSETNLYQTPDELQGEILQS